MISRALIEKTRVPHLTISGSLIVRAAEKLGLRYTLWPERVIQILHKNKSYFFKGTMTPGVEAVTARLADNKFFCREFLRKHHFPVPRTVVLDTPAGWKKLERSRLTFPLVVKPITASHGNGATMNIRTDADLKAAAYRAFRFMKKAGEGSRALVEEFFEGHDLRLLVIGRRVVSVVEREPAYVTGDGVSTIRQLIKQFNTTWESKAARYDLPLCPIPFDAEVGRCLRTQRLQLSSIPHKGSKIRLRWNANVSTGGRTTDVTELVPRAIKQTAVQCAKLLNLPVVGVDFLCKDITSRDTSRRNLVILEANAAPGFDIHSFPYRGKGRDVAMDLLKFTLGIKS